MSSRYKAFPLGEGGRGPDEGRVSGNDPLTGIKMNVALISRLRAAAPRGKPCRGGACPARSLPIKCYLFVKPRADMSGPYKSKY